VDEFIQYAVSKKLNVKDLMKKKVEVEEFNDGPPCLQHLYSIGGFPEHTRNDGMFNVGIYLKRKYPDKWQDLLPAYNDTMCKGSQTLSDINGICKTLSAKEYTYKCKASPIKPHCVRRTCLRRQFGVGTGPKTMGIEITSITKYPASPTIWCVEIDGARFEVDTDTLFYQSAFAKKCMDVISRCPAPLPAEEWQKYLDEKIKDADEVPPPEDADEVGRSIRECLAASREGVPHPKSFTNLFDPVLDLAGVKSLGTFVKSAKCVEVETSDGAVVTLIPTRNGGVDDGFAPLPNKSEVALGSDEALGSAAVAALAKSE
jgi:hypothetical protein